MKKYFYFIVFSYFTAFIFEFIANTIGDGRLFRSHLWPLFFLIWYGSIYSVTFLLFSKKSLWFPVVTWMILGPVAEAVIFHRLNIVIDPIIYGLMFFIPFLAYKKYR